MKTPCEFDDYLKRLRRELRKLEGTESPIARRNARKRVLTAMRTLRASVDTEYPAIVDRTGVKRLKTFAGRLARLKRAGWVELREEADAGHWAAAGVRVVKLEHVDDGDEKNGRPGVYHVAWLIPLWARAIGLDKALLNKAKKSRKIRNAAVTAMALS